MTDDQTAVNAVIFGMQVIALAIGLLLGWTLWRRPMARLRAALADAHGLLEAVERERDEADRRTETANRFLGFYYHECCDREDELTELRRQLARADAALDPNTAPENTP
jgi:hypothetical protein